MYIRYYSEFIVCLQNYYNYFQLNEVRGFQQSLLVACFLQLSIPLILLLVPLIQFFTALQLE